jgi:molybdate transport system substrate-binding protein
MPGAAEIKVMASAAFKEAYLELVPQFERVTGHKVLTLWIPTVQMMSRLKAGETVDLVIMAGGAIDELIRLGKIAPGSRVDLAKSGVGAAIRAGAPHPDISSAEALKRALIAAKSIVISTGPSGVYLAGLFQRMGVTDELKPKMKQVMGEPTGAVVARGEAEIGFQQMCELLPVAGIELLGPLAAEFSGSRFFCRSARTAPDAARSLVAFLTAPDVSRDQEGMQPAERFRYRQAAKADRQFSLQENA